MLDHMKNTLRNTACLDICLFAFNAQELSGKGPSLNGYPIYHQCSYHIETSQLIYSANQMTGFYMMRKLVVIGLRQLIWIQVVHSYTGTQLTAHRFQCYTAAVQLM